MSSTKKNLLICSSMNTLSLFQKVDKRPFSTSSIFFSLNIVFDIYFLDHLSPSIFYLQLSFLVIFNHW